MYERCSVEYINQQVGCIVYRCIPTYTYLKLSYIYIYMRNIIAVLQLPRYIQKGYTGVQIICSDILNIAL